MATMGHDSAAEREFTTPEGVPIRLPLASKFRRGLAFLADLGVIFTFVVLVGIATLVATGGDIGSSFVTAVSLIVIFLARNFYFVLVELMTSGRTLGKMLLGIRVVDRRGGALSADQLFVRNVTREVEFFLPLIVVFKPSVIIADAAWWVSALSLLWLGVLALMPLFNRDRLRVGDLLGGTMVVREPRVRLLDDIGEPEATTRAEPTFQFARAQIDMYGIYELQVLEELLRDDSDPHTLTVVRNKVMDKIGWEGDRQVAPRTFLEDFYRAQRQRLEHQMLLGERREHKRAGKLGDERD